MILHLMNDEKFVENTVLEFEKYFPGKNIFVIDTSNKKNPQLMIYVKIDNIIVFNMQLSSRKAIKKISEICNQDIHVIFIHSYCLLKGYTSLALKKKYNCKTLWVCNGADIYGKLMIDGKYELFDKNPLFRRIYSYFGFYIRNIKYSLLLTSNLFKYQKTFYKHLDFFCTWNYYDFELFNQHYQSNAQLISFHYPTTDSSVYINYTDSVEKYAIILNQSASKSGNHITILKKLKKLDINKSLSKLFVPLSYGAKSIVTQVKKYGNENLSYCFYPIEEFLTKDKYFELLKKIKCAFFGHRRQEAANNIFFLLGFGAKVFLRKENNLLSYFKDKGFYIYEYESEFNSLNDLKALSDFEQSENKRLIIKEFSEEALNLEFKIISEIINC